MAYDWSDPMLWAGGAGTLAGIGSTIYGGNQAQRAYASGRPDYNQMVAASGQPMPQLPSFPQIQPSTYGDFNINKYMQPLTDEMTRAMLRPMETSMGLRGMADSNQMTMNTGEIMAKNAGERYGVAAPYAAAEQSGNAANAQQANMSNQQAKIYEILAGNSNINSQLNRYMNALGSRGGYNSSQPTMPMVGDMGGLGKAMAYQQIAGKMGGGGNQNDMYEMIKKIYGQGAGGGSGAMDPQLTTGGYGGDVGGYNLYGTGANPALSQAGNYSLMNPGAASTGGLNPSDYSLNGGSDAASGASDAGGSFSWGDYL